MAKIDKPPSVKESMKTYDTLTTKQKTAVDTACQKIAEATNMTWAAVHHSVIELLHARRLSRKARF